MKSFRNIASTILGIPLFFLLSYLSTYLVMLFLQIPIIGKLLTWYIPIERYIPATASFITVAIVYWICHRISDCEKRDYPTMIVFTISAIVLTIGMITQIISVGFQWHQFIINLIWIITCCIAVGSAYDD